MADPTDSQRLRAEDRPMDLMDARERGAALAASILDIPFCPQTPHPAQAKFLLDLKTRDSLFGGSAGPGKSSALLMACLMFVDVPGYASLILRRTMTELTQPGALLDRAHEWLDPHPEVQWQEQKKRFRFPSGAILQFGFLDTLRDQGRYQSAEYHSVSIDEIGELSRANALFMFSRIRRPKDIDGSIPLGRVPLRYRASANPGVRWVYERYVQDPDDPESEFTYPDDLDRSDRSFHPAKLDDNPSLDAREYEQTLAHLDPLTRKMLLSGIWVVAVKGNVLRREWFPLIDMVPAPIVATVRYWDLAGTSEEQAVGKDPDYTVGCLAHRLADNRMVVAGMIRKRWSSSEIEAGLRLTAESDGVETPIWIEQEPGSGGKSMIQMLQRNHLQGFTVKPHNKRVDKVTAAQPWAALAGNQRGVLLFRGHWNAALFDEMTSFPGEGHDDTVDAVSGAYFALFGKTTGEATVATPSGAVIAALAAQEERRAAAALAAGEAGVTPAGLLLPGGRATVYRRPVGQPGLAHARGRSGRNPLAGLNPRT